MIPDNGLEHSAFREASCCLFLREMPGLNYPSLISNQIYFSIDFALSEIMPSASIYKRGKLFGTLNFAST
jgi:hypothetical protein